MLFISFAKGHKAKPKGVITEEKEKRMRGISGAFVKRSFEIHGRFKALNKGRLDELTRSAVEAEALWKERPSHKEPAFEKRLKLALLKNASLDLAIHKDMLDYAKAQNASHAQIDIIEKQIKGILVRAVIIKEGRYS